jgi:hypothetical protein
MNERMKGQYYILNDRIEIVVSKLTMTQFHPFIRSFNLYIIADERTKSQQAFAGTTPRKPSLSPTHSRAWTNG